FVNALNVSTTYPVSPRGDMETISYEQETYLHRRGVFFGRSPSLLPESITTGRFGLAGPLAYCQCQLQQGVWF
ncbi:hypothetical protein J6590_107558, partial [Homalodisca vitripennis]